MGKGKKGKRKQRKQGGAIGRAPAGGQPASSAEQPAGPSGTADLPEEVLRGGGDSDDSVETALPGDPEPNPVPLLRTIDRFVGIGEQTALVGFVVFLVTSAVAQTISSNLFNKGIEWSLEGIRYSVFFIAMFGAALAAQKRRMITMDILTRLMSARSKAYGRVVIAGCVVFLCYLLIKGSLHLREGVQANTEDYSLMAPSDVILALPIGAALIAFHYTVHALIDAIYLAAGRTPPAPEGMQVH